MSAQRLPGRRVKILVSAPLPARLTNRYADESQRLRAAGIAEDGLLGGHIAISGAGGGPYEIWALCPEADAWVEAIFKEARGLSWAAFDAIDRELQAASSAGSSDDALRARWTAAYVAHYGEQPMTGAQMLGPLPADKCRAPALTPPLCSAGRCHRCGAYLEPDGLCPTARRA